jgi:hypothetical protein
LVAPQKQDLAGTLNQTGEMFAIGMLSASLEETSVGCFALSSASLINVFIVGVYVVSRGLVGLTA